MYLKPEITHLTKPRPERLDIRPEKVRLSESAKQKNSVKITLEKVKYIFGIL